MRRTFQAIATAVTMLVLAAAASAQDSGGAPAAEKPRTQEFGLTTKELQQTIEKVEGLIAKYMREAGFEYVACDFQQVKKGMSADKNLPGVSEEEFIGKYGFGLSTFY